MTTRHSPLPCFLILLFVASALLAAAPKDRPPNPLGGGRYAGFCGKAAEGPHMSVASATHFGTAGHEEFNAVGQLPDGTIVAFGNAWGPQLPGKVQPVVLGKGTHSGQAPAMVKDRGGAEVPDPKGADRAGIMVCYTPNANGVAISRIIRFDWGVATITAARMSGDGQAMILSGACQKNFASFAATAKANKTIPYKAPDAPAADPKKRGRAPKAADPATLCDVYVARLSPTGAAEWVVVLEKNNDPPDELFTDAKGNVYFEAKGLIRVTANGGDVSVINSKTNTGTSKWLGVDPGDSGAFFGGDRNTHTGYQPYRQPYLYKFNEKGEKVLTLWEPNPKECACGGSGNGLCSDSAIRKMAFDKNGDWLFAGWSDGGNTVFSRQATNWREGVPGKGMGMDASGVNASSLAHLMRVDPKTRQTKAYTLWVGYVPTFFGDASDARATKARGKPNGAGIDQLVVLDNGSVAFTGGAATGLVQTPNAFWKDPARPEKHGGATLTVFRPDLSNLMFSSYTPGVAGLHLCPIKGGVAVVGRSTGTDGWVQPTASPSVNADQQYAGASDGWLAVLKFPMGNSVFGQDR